MDLLKVSIPFRYAENWLDSLDGALEEMFQFLLGTLKTAVVALL